MTVQLEAWTPSDDVDLHLPGPVAGRSEMMQYAYMLASAT